MTPLAELRRQVADLRSAIGIVRDTVADPVVIRLVHAGHLDNPAAVLIEQAEGLTAALDAAEDLTRALALSLSNRAIVMALASRHGAPGGAALVAHARFDHPRNRDLADGFAAEVALERRLLAAAPAAAKRHTQATDATP